MIADTTRIYDTVRIKIPVYEQTQIIDTVKYFEKTVAGDSLTFLIFLVSCITLIVVAGLTLIAYYVQGSQKYKNAYYTKIIEKRFSAYEKLQDLISFLNLYIYQDKKVYAHAVFDSWESFDDFYTQLLLTGNVAYWFNANTEDKLSEFSTFIRNNFDFFRNTDKNIAEMAHEHFYEIQEFMNILKQLLLLDITTLHTGKLEHRDVEIEQKSDPEQNPSSNNPEKS